ncbi:OsmC family protein [Pseudoxanthomonas indica]|uniref:OsmC-like protein n=1 Tax=Pseudoxanthomonas indica TaxID=428993 RepID=A0A1T5K887_9GAMM|nr:OsmC family protein [Pseudoxanthomonas indica]GGD47353.1 hypothetical protein GCM10007235_19080 [Pseudoxanthomonas indica]SKC59679.1 OsmC-like protein [Pseudoxanthomonas indica]
MNTQHDIAEAMQRAINVFVRRPDMGLHDDAAGRAVWKGGTRVTTYHDSGLHMDTDMPRELGGTGDCVSPGWLFRAGIAACSTTVIAMIAASEGITLDRLEIVVGSQSDTRGVLGMHDNDGELINPGPQAITMDVQISAAGVDAAVLRRLVEQGLHRSPMQSALLRHPPLTVNVSVDQDMAA